MLLSSAEQRFQKRHTIAAVVYFLYGLFYLFGAQYLTTMGMSERGMSGSKWWFWIGATLLVLFPLLIYKRFAIGLSLWGKGQRRYKTLCINFTLLLGVLVSIRVYFLIDAELYAKTPLHLAGLVIGIINAVMLLWAGLSKPVWTTRHT